MFGKSFGQYLRLQAWVLGAIVVAFVARWGLTSAGLAAGRWASVTWILVVGAVYYGVVVHRSGFGSYKHLYPLNLFQSLLAEMLVAVGIVVAMLTETHNIFTVPDFVQGFVQGQDGRSWAHALAHVVIPGALVLPLVGWALSALVMLVTKRVG